MAAVRVGSAREHAQPGSLLLVVHDFVARSDDELSLAKGDRIELIERDDDFGDGWFLGRHMGSGNTGLFPEGKSPCCRRAKQARQSLTLSSVHGARAQGYAPTTTCFSKDE